MLHSRNTDFADDDNYETMLEQRSCHINHSPRAFGVSLFKSLFFCVFFTILTISIFYKKNFVEPQDWRQPDDVGGRIKKEERRGACGKNA